MGARLGSFHRKWMAEWRGQSISKIRRSFLRCRNTENRLSLTGVDRSGCEHCVGVFLSLALRVAHMTRHGCLSFLSARTLLRTFFSFLLFSYCLSCVKFYLCSHTLNTGTQGWVKEGERLQHNGTFKQLEQLRRGCRVISLLREVLKQGHCHLPRF